MVVGIYADFTVLRIANKQKKNDFEVCYILKKKAVTIFAKVRAFPIMKITIYVPFFFLK